MRTNRTCHHGFTLVEVLLALTLLGAFSLLAYRLIGANMQTATTTLVSNWKTARFDRAVRMLRADVADSISIEMPSPGLIRIHMAGKQNVDWKTVANSMSRSTETSPRSWDLGQPLQLKLDGAVVLLSVSSDDQIAMAQPPKGASR